MDSKSWCVKTSGTRFGFLLMATFTMGKVEDDDA
jgi:hypothetical protein